MYSGRRRFSCTYIKGGSQEVSRKEGLQDPMGSTRETTEKNNGFIGRIKEGKDPMSAWVYGDEMFSDIYKIKETAGGLCYEVEGKVVCRTENIDDALIGGNASAEIQDEGVEASSVSGVDIVLNHKLQETSFTKESYKQYIKEYMKRVKCRLEECAPDRVKPFMSGAAEQVKKILGNFKNYQTMNLRIIYQFCDMTVAQHDWRICYPSTADLASRLLSKPNSGMHTMAFPAFG
ncbi:TCTP protein, partial [Polypterus senegalus]